MIDFSFITQFRTKAKYKKTYKNAKASYLNRIRWAVSMFYFSVGLSFASWASRIPDIKLALHLSEGELGSVLFMLPLGQLATMLISGKAITKFGSRKTVIASVFLYAAGLILIGLSDASWQLSAALFLFGVFGNLANISVNTQGVYTEVLFRRPILSAFHGMWSFAGFIGALVGLLMLAIGFSPVEHFLVVLVIVTVLIVSNYKFLILAKERLKAEKKKLFSKPDAGLLWLGVIAFCCMASEGVMFDWSGVYFKEIIKAPGPLVILGYTSFMIMMSGGRFFGDRVIHKWGSKQIMHVSGIAVSIGLFAAVFFPFVIPSTLAFMLVGLGVSTIVPTVYSLAGKNTAVPPGEALTTVSSVSFLGFLIGPPIVGYIAELSSLRFSFAFIGIFGFLIAFIISKVKSIP